MTRDIIMFLFGAVTGITLLITWACCVIGDRESRREEEEMRENDRT